MAKFLVTGVAGYIGSSVARLLVGSGHSVIGLDNLSTGMKEFIPEELDFVEGDVTDVELMLALGRRVDGVIHVGGLKFASESMISPEKFYRANVTGTLNAGLAALESRSRIIVFSSSCSVYGEAKKNVISESAPLAPISPYGRSKLMAESILNDLSYAHQMKVVSLRYFNVIGAFHLGAFDNSNFNLFPNLCRAIQNGTKFNVYGGNLPTRDGSCVRDYVDVHDISRAHILVAQKMLDNDKLRTEYNLGSAKGTSVLEVIKSFEQVTKTKVEVEYCQHRKGDPFEITSSFDAASKDFGWEPVISMSESIEKQWSAFHRE